MCGVVQEAERLKQENEELHKLGEHAVLDQQVNKAVQEVDKLKWAADAYKKDLLQKQVSELQAELAQSNKRLKVAEEEKSGRLMAPSVLLAAALLDMLCVWCSMLSTIHLVC